MDVRREQVAKIRNGEQQLRRDESTQHQARELRDAKPGELGPWSFCIMPWSHAPDPPAQERTDAVATTSTSIAAKLMTKMGYKEGQGLGRYGQGIVCPIEAQQLTPRAGLGLTEPPEGPVSVTGPFTHLEGPKVELCQEQHELVDLNVS